jgi:pimeloyl-ACP methyl ester carboxylesterase
MHIAEQGEGPLVLLLHGWPETWYSWRHQIEALSAAGYRAVAPDQRGYGATDRPDTVDQYSIFHLVGDVVTLVRELGEERAVIVGHDWGSMVASNIAVLRPEVVRGLVCISIPPIPRGPLPPMTVTEQRFGKGFYQNYFQEPGVAEASLEKDVAALFVWRSQASATLSPRKVSSACSSNQTRCRTGSPRRTWRRSSSSSPQPASPAV